MSLLKKLLNERCMVELVSNSEVTSLEKKLDKLMWSLGLDVEFSKHFIERLLGREKHVTEEEIVNTFEKLKKKYKKKLLKAKKEDDYTAVLRDFGKDLNFVFAIQDRANTDIEDLKLITFMSKDPAKFKTNREGGDELKVK